MKTGLSTSSFYPLETEKSLIKIGESGIKNTELFFNAQCELEKDFIKELTAVKNHYGINIVSIHPTMSLAESFMLFSAYDRRKKEGLCQFKRYGEICEALGAKYIILHGGKPNGVLDDRQYCERFVEISDASAETGGILLQENVAKYRAGNLDFLKMMAEELGDNAKFCLDIKQCIRGGYSPFEAAEALKEKIKHIHISDHTADRDCLIPGDGEFGFADFFSRLKTIGYNGYAIIEVYANAYDNFDELLEKSWNFIKNEECLKNT